jgi:hypothetical protein
VGRLLIVIVCMTSIANADALHAGLNLRADPGTHPIRINGGVERGGWDANLVLDPMFWTDGQHDLDAYLARQVSEGGWAVIGGWRTSAVSLRGGHQFQEKLILGVGAPLPKLGAALRWRWAFELATVIVKHGADLPSDWLSFAQGRDFIDLINFGMWVTFEYER